MITEDASPEPGCRVVFVADDGGVDEARNRGIVTACREGLVGAVSVLANGDAVEDLRDRLFELPQDRRPGVGLHLNLTEGRALLVPIAGLTDGGRTFVGGKEAIWHRAFAGGIDPVAVRREASAQIARLRSLGLEPTHADGHQHVHLLPGVRDGLAMALDRVPGVRYVRAARPIVPDGENPVSWPRLAIAQLADDWVAADSSGRAPEAAFGSLVAEADRLVAGRRRAADAMVGLDLLRGWFAADAVDRIRLAQTRGARLIEFMCHPGDCTAGSAPFSSCADRERERDALCGAALTDGLAALGVTAGRFPGVGAD